MGGQGRISEGGAVHCNDTEVAYTFAVHLHTAGRAQRQ